MGSTGQAKNPQLRINFSEKLFENETDLMNQETIKNLQSFRKLTVTREEDFSENESSDGEFRVNLSERSSEEEEKKNEKGSLEEKLDEIRQIEKSKLAWDNEYENDAIEGLLSETKDKLTSLYEKSKFMSNLKTVGPEEEGLLKLKSQELFNKNQK